MAEHGFRKAGVVGSTPTIGCLFFPPLATMSRAVPKPDARVVSPANGCASTRRCIRRVGESCRAENRPLVRAARVHHARKHFSKKFRAPLYTRRELAIHLACVSGPTALAKQVSYGGSQCEPPKPMEGLKCATAGPSIFSCAANARRSRRLAFCRCFTGVFARLPRSGPGEGSLGQTGTSVTRFCQV